MSNVKKNTCIITAIIWAPVSVFTLDYRPVDSGKQVGLGGQINSLMNSGKGWQEKKVSSRSHTKQRFLVQHFCWWNNYTHWFHFSSHHALFAVWIYVIYIKTCSFPMIGPVLGKGWIPHDLILPVIPGIITPWCFVARADSRFAPSQWETALLCNNVSHWLGTNLVSPVTWPWPSDPFNMEQPW